MSSKWILSILMAAVVGWTQVGCMLPEEGTIIYDQDYPEIPTDNVGGSGSGGDSGGDSSGDSSGTGGGCLLYTSPSPRDRQKSRMPSSA